MSVQVVPFLRYWSLQFDPFPYPPVHETEKVFDLDEWESVNADGFDWMLTGLQVEDVPSTNAPVELVEDGSYTSPSAAPVPAAM